MFGFIGDLLSGGMGAGFQAQGTNIQQPLTGQDLINGNNQALGGLGQQQAFLNAVQGQHGLFHLNDVYNQYQGLANGTGPNPAQAMLEQATGQNNAAQAAMMAGQRGASQNAGLIARQAGMQGAANQQNMIGQAANMQAQQQLAGIQGAAGIAGQQVGTQQNALTGLNQFAQGYQQNIGNMLSNQNNANVAMQSNINSANAGVAGVNAATQGKILSGAMNSIGSGVSMMAGMPPAAAGAGGAAALAHGGPVAPTMSHVHQYFNGYATGGPIQQPLVGEAYAQNMQPVPGAPLEQGDSPKNDTVPAMLSPGEIIIPRSHAMDPLKAAAFAHAVSMKMGRGGK